MFKENASFVKDPGHDLSPVESLRQVVRPAIIGISGGRGSFSEEAAELYCSKEDIRNKKLEYLRFVEQVLASLESGTIDIGIFAIENSNGGVVLEYLPAIGAHRFKVAKTFELDVHHMLLVKPGTKHGQIKHIVSQKQAIAQCRQYIKRKWRDTGLEEYIDTATAAEDLAAGKLSPDCAVIASASCAEMYDLDILDSSIQDNKFNYTTFIVATRLD